MQALLPYAGTFLMPYAGTFLLPCAGTFLSKAAAAIVEGVNGPLEQHHVGNVPSMATEGNVLEDPLQVFVRVDPVVPRVHERLVLEDVLHEVELRRHLPATHT